VSDAFLFDAVRTPRGRGKSNGSLHTVKPLHLLATTLAALRDRTQLDTRQVDDVIMGCVTQTGEQGSCIARAAVLAAGYDEYVPGVTLNRFCASGLESVAMAAAKVAAGYQDIVIAGGVEHMSRVPMGSDGGPFWDPEMSLEYHFVPQGISADLLATLHGVSREQVDRFALLSQQRAAAARERGAFRRSLAPVVDPTGLVLLDQDEYIRADVTLEGLGRLPAAFEAMGRQFGLDSVARSRYPHVEVIEHVHTAGNSSGIVDGAAALLVGNRAGGEKLGLRPRARIRSTAVVGDDPVTMLTGPMPATRKALQMAKMSIADVDLFEVNEAFAVVPLLYMDELGVDPERVNVNGGAIALGHPLGATGAILLNTIVDALEDRDRETGVVTLCAGGGMGIALVVERV
jgi:acetyl-CoA C-acetyltransferase